MHLTMSPDDRTMGGSALFSLSNRSILPKPAPQVTTVKSVQGIGPANNDNLQVHTASCHLKLFTLNCVACALTW